MAFLGEHICKVDVKGRLRIPVALKQQLTQDAPYRFVVNRGFEQCLVLYPFDVWERIRSKVDKLNTFKKNERSFVRFFYRGATELVLDSADRINVPPHLLAYAGIDKELVLASHKDTIEVWDRHKYEAQLDVDAEDFASLAERVMGDLECNE